MASRDAGESGEALTTSESERMAATRRIINHGKLTAIHSGLGAG